MDPDEAFWELSLLRGPKVHPHSSLSVSLQRISPPLTGGGPLSSAHPAHAPALQLHFCDTIFIYHSTQRRRCRKSSARALAVSGRFLASNTPAVRGNLRINDTLPRHHAITSTTTSHPLLTEVSTLATTFEPTLQLRASLQERSEMPCTALHAQVPRPDPGSTDLSCTLSCSGGPHSQRESCAGSSPYRAPTTACRRCLGHSTPGRG